MNATDESHGVDEYKKGMEALKANKLEDAVQLLGQGLQTISEKFGEESLQCAGAYYQYGLALFHRAQEESDVFGTTLQTAVAKHEEGPSTSAAIKDQAGDKVQEEEAAAAAAGDQDEGDDDEEDEDNEEEEEESPDDDMQLAWENLEVARKIYSDNATTHAQELASVHTALADLATEQESFEEALSDYQRAQELLTPLLTGNDRQLAELHFKTGLTLHFLNQPVQGLQEVQKAIKICEGALEDVKAQKEPSIDAQARDLEAVLSDLRAKEEELEDAVKEVEKTKKTLQAAFKSVIGNAPAATTPAAASNVVDLGVVGQGKKRINLAPIAPSAAQDGGQQAAKPRQKRSLEDLMGGEGASVGFGDPVAEAGKKQAFVGGADAVAAVSMKPAGKQSTPAVDLQEQMEGQK